MSVMKQMQSMVFGMNDHVPVFATEWPRTLREFVKMLPPELVALIVDSRPLYEPVGGVNGLVYRDMVTVHEIACWAASGMPCFNLTHSAAAAFALTDPDAVRLESFSAPFPTFVCQLPVPFLTNEEGTDVHALIWHEFVASSANPEDRRLSVHVVGPDMSTRLMLALFTHPKKYETIGEWLQDFPNSTSSGQPAPARFVAILRILTNLCLYIAASGRGAPITKRAKSTAAHPSRIATGTEPAIWQLGREIKIDKPLVAAASALVDQRGVRAEWTLRARFTVRGHWRNQAYGTAHSERRLRWIAPYWKGPADGIGIQHLYKTNEGEDAS